MSIIEDGINIIEESEKDTKDLFLIEINSNNVVVGITNILSLNGKTHEEIAADRIPLDPANTIHAYRGTIPDSETNMFIFNGSSLSSDDNRNSIIEENKNIEIAQKYLDKTDRYVARLYETNKAIPQSVTDLRTHYRNFLDGKGLFSDIDAESQIKLAEISN